MIQFHIFPKSLGSPDNHFPSLVIKEKKRRSRGEREKALHHLGFGPPEPTGPAGRPTPPTGRSLPFLFLCSVSLQGQGRPRPPRRPHRERIRATPQAPLISPHPLTLPRRPLSPLSLWPRPLLQIHLAPTHCRRRVAAPPRPPGPPRRPDVSTSPAAVCCFVCTNNLKAGATPAPDPSSSWTAVAAAFDSGHRHCAPVTRRAFVRPPGELLPLSLLSRRPPPSLARSPQPP